MPKYFNTPPTPSTNSADRMITRDLQDRTIAAILEGHSRAEAHMAATEEREKQQAANDAAATAVQAVVSIPPQARPER